MIRAEAQGPTSVWACLWCMVSFAVVSGLRGNRCFRDVITTLWQQGGGGWCQMKPDSGRWEKVAPWLPPSCRPKAQMSHLWFQGGILCLRCKVQKSRFVNSVKRPKHRLILKDQFFSKRELFICFVVFESMKPRWGIWALVPPPSSPRPNSVFL